WAAGSALTSAGSAGGVPTAGFGGGALLAGLGGGALFAGPCPFWGGGAALVRGAVGGRPARAPAPSVRPMALRCAAARGGSCLVPGFGDGFYDYDYGCGYGYPYYTAYSCYPPSYY